MSTEQLTFHKGVDYAVVMRPNQTTEAALAQLFGQDRHVTKYGNMFAAAPDLLEMTKLLKSAAEYQIRVARKAGDEEGARMATVTLNMANAAIAKAEGRDFP